MQRYFVSKESVDLSQSQITIVGDDVAHIVKVMRSAPGTKIICCDVTGNCFLAEIESLDKEQVICRVIEPLIEDQELPVHVTIAQGLPKGDKMELVIQKGTELGAHAFVPFTSTRTIVQLDGKKEQKRMERWGKIAKEAAEQAHRKRVPEIDPVLSWKQLLAKGGEFDLALLAYEHERASTLHQHLLTMAQGKRILLAIGPEGGFSDTEVKEAMDRGFKPVMLGKRILRTETAALYGLAAISYYYEQLMEGGNN